MSAKMNDLMDMDAKMGAPLFVPIDSVLNIPDAWIMGYCQASGLSVRQAVAYWIEQGFQQEKATLNTKEPGDLDV
jgi:hypothetical protein